MNIPFSFGITSDFFSMSAVSGSFRKIRISGTPNMINSTIPPGSVCPVRISAMEITADP